LFRLPTYHPDPKEVFKEWLVSYDNVPKNLAATQHKLAEKEREYTALETKFNAFKKNIQSQLDSVQVEAAKVLCSIEDGSKQLRDIVSALHAEKKSDDKFIEDMNTELEQLHRELNKARACLREVTNVMQESSTVLDALKDELTACKSALRDSNSLASDLHEEIKRCEDELCKANDLIPDLHRRNSELEQENARLAQLASPFKLFAKFTAQDITNLVREATALQRELTKCRQHCRRVELRNCVLTVIGTIQKQRLTHAGGLLPLHVADELVSPRPSPAVEELTPEIALKNFLGLTNSDIDMFLSYARDVRTANPLFAVFHPDVRNKISREYAFSRENLPAAKLVLYSLLVYPASFHEKQVTEFHEHKKDISSVLLELANGLNFLLHDEGKRDFLQNLTPKYLVYVQPLMAVAYLTGKKQDIALEVSASSRLLPTLMRPDKIKAVTDAEITDLAHHFSLVQYVVLKCSKEDFERKNPLSEPKRAWNIIHSLVKQGFPSHKQSPEKIASDLKQALQFIILTLTLHEKQTTGGFKAWASS